MKPKISKTPTRKDAYAIRLKWRSLRSSIPMPSYASCVGSGEIVGPSKPKTRRKRSPASVRRWNGLIEVLKKPYEDHDFRAGRDHNRPGKILRPRIVVWAKDQIPTVSQVGSSGDRDVASSVKEATRDEKEKPNPTPPPDDTYVEISPGSFVKKELKEKCALADGTCFGKILDCRMPVRTVCEKHVFQFRLSVIVKPALTVARPRRRGFR